MCLSPISASFGMASPDGPYDEHVAGGQVGIEHALLVRGLERPQDSVQEVDGVAGWQPLGVLLDDLGEGGAFVELPDDHGSTGLVRAHVEDGAERVDLYLGCLLDVRQVRAGDLGIPPQHGVEHLQGHHVLGPLVDGLVDAADRAASEDLRHTVVLEERPAHHPFSELDGLARDGAEVEDVVMLLFAMRALGHSHSPGHSGHHS